MRTRAGSLGVSQAGDRTRLRLRRTAILLPADDGIYAGSLERVDLIAQPDARTLILDTGYSSRPGAPMSMCGAGEEAVIRVVRTTPTVRQTASLRVAGCWDNIEHGKITWDASAGELGFDGETLRYRIDAAGRLVKVRR